MEKLSRPLRWLFDPADGPAHCLVARWLFLRALAAIYFSAFLSLLFQIKGLIGPEGILPAQHYLADVASFMDWHRYWYAPTLFWASTSSTTLMAVMWIGLIASLLALLNLWPRLNFLVCFVCFLAFVTAARAFSGYQSDGMLLEAGFIALFFAPPGLRPGWGAEHRPARLSLWLLQWEWFRIYFESGVVKLLSGDQQWRTLTAMDEYYQNGPLPTWVGWYVEHLPHWFHEATAAGTLLMELTIVWMLFLPRRVRLICFLIVTPWEIGVILTGNYTFLNYLVLSLGLLLLDDRTLGRFVPARFQPPVVAARSENLSKNPQLLVDVAVPLASEIGPVALASEIGPGFSPRDMPEQPPESIEESPQQTQESPEPRGLRWYLRVARVAVASIFLVWIGYVTSAELVRMLWRDAPLPEAPIAALEPFRIANRYGLFAVMTRGRYEIEFQGSNDGQSWTPYEFRYKPQTLNAAPGIYAPYQPRFDWNLWFASLGDWRDNQIVTLTEEKLLANDADVLRLFKGNPFAQAPPRFLRAVLWQYWFTSMQEKRATGDWWKRELLGLYAPVITIRADGRYAAVEMPRELPPHD